MIIQLYVYGYELKVGLSIWQRWVDNVTDVILQLELLIYKSYDFVFHHRGTNDANFTVCLQQENYLVANTHFYFFDLSKAFTIRFCFFTTEVRMMPTLLFACNRRITSLQTHLSTSSTFRKPLPYNKKVSVVGLKSLDVEEWVSVIQGMHSNARSCVWINGQYSEGVGMGLVCIMAPQPSTIHPDARTIFTGVWH